MFDDMFESQETHAVMATALNHASTAMLFALEHMDAYVSYVHEKQASGAIAAGDFDSPTVDTEPIEPGILAHDLSVAAMLLHGLAHIAQDKAEDAQVSRATASMDAELNRLLG